MQKQIRLWVTAVLLTFGLCHSGLWAKPTTASQAGQVVEGWLRLDARPLGATLGQQIANVKTFSNEDGEPIYYIVYLKPSGFVIVAADDEVEPIIGFCSKGTYDPSVDNPLGALVTGDLNGRITAVRRWRQNVKGTKRKRALSSGSKWRQLESIAGRSPGVVMDLPSISDVRVGPLVQSKWGQGSVCGNYCYNYYTPNNYVTGCVAIVMSQIMRYHEHPTSGIGVHSFSIEVDGSAQSADTRGGNGTGGPYDWNQMVVVPNCATTLTQRQAIGALCYDAGVSIGMSYTSSSSSAWVADARDELLNTFGYSNAVYAQNNLSNIPTDKLTNMVNPNLDGSLPVVLGLRRTGGGHGVVADGYGYNTSTLYHHLNMGWTGLDDAWYNLPDVDASYHYTSVEECVYNIYTSGSGEIVSGRVTDAAGDPINGATVTGQRASGGTYNSTTNTKGIYALAKIPSGSSYTITVTKVGYNFSPRTESTGTSVNQANTSGNLWGIDFQASAGVLTLYVDGVAGSDVSGNGSQANPYKTVQKALDMATDGYTIIIRAGDYNENVRFDKRLRVEGEGGSVRIGD